MANYSSQDKTWKLEGYVSQNAWAIANGHTIEGYDPSKVIDCAGRAHPPVPGVTPRRRNVAREAELATVAGPHGNVPVKQPALGAPTHDGLFYYGEGFKPRCDEDDHNLWERFLACEELYVGPSRKGEVTVRATFMADPPVLFPLVTWEA